jgi:hypothetical protein
LSFSCEPAAFGIGETKPPPTQVLLEQTVFFLQILDLLKLTAVDPTGEHQKEQMKRQKQWRHRSQYIGLSNTHSIVFGAATIVV